MVAHKLTSGSESKIKTLTPRDYFLCVLTV